MILESQSSREGRLRCVAGDLLKKTFFSGTDSAIDIAFVLCDELERVKKQNKVAKPLNDWGVHNTDPTDLEIELQNRVEELGNENFRLTNLIQTGKFKNVD